MKLYVQLALVCCSLLAIPWSGCEFLRANEAALRTLQQQGLAAAGASLADGLYGNTDLIYSDPERARSADTKLSLTARRLAGAPVVDGYFDEWEDQPAQRFGPERRGIAVKTGVHNNQLYLAVAIEDQTKRYNASANGRQPTGDRLHLRTWIKGRRQDYVVATSAPGTVRARLIGRSLPGANPDAIRGVWVDRAEGYQIELALPLAIATSRLGLYVTDEDEGGVSTKGNTAPLATDAPPWLIIPPQRLESLVRNYDASALNVAIYDRWGRELARSLPESDDTSLQPTSSLFAGWLYRQILDTPQATVEPVRYQHRHVDSDDIKSALRGIPSHGLAVSQAGLDARYAAPIQSESGLLGVVVTSQPREQYLSATASAFEGLLVRGTAALLFALLSVVAFAALTSWRIVRLTRAAETLATEKGTALPATPLGDEIDQLARRLSAQFREQHRLLNYLRALPRSLAHEIRTPVAIAKSTLEHLREPTMTAEQRDELLDRADAGLARLNHMINAMNEANRLESAIDNEPLSDTNLVDLLSDLCKAYRQTFPDWRFDFVTDVDAASAPLAPDLIVQGMDKLVANATSFSDPGATILLHLEQRGFWWRITVGNNGPLLPADTDQLFAPMISMRDRQQQQSGNIGLGLYIVSLVARRHRGEPWAENRADGTGVQVGFTVHR